MASEIKLDFEWDEDKAATNFKKHKVTFEEAKTVFADPFSITISDPKHPPANLDLLIPDCLPTERSCLFPIPSESIESVL